jgi:hypothetical protein
MLNAQSGKLYEAFLYLLAHLLLEQRYLWSFTVCQILHNLAFLCDLGLFDVL